MLSIERYHVVNIACILLIYLLFQLLRFLLEQKERAIMTITTASEAEQYFIIDTMIMMALFSGLYCLTFVFRTDLGMYASVGICIACIGVVIDQRFRHDLLKGVYNTQELAVNYKIKDNINHFIVRHMIDHILRSYLYISYFFSVLYVSIIPRDSELTPDLIHPYYAIENTSENVFVDFFVFSFSALSTLSSGFINPVSPMAKVLWSIEIILGIGFIGLIVGVFSSTVSNITHQTKKHQLRFGKRWQLFGQLWSRLHTGGASLWQSTLVIIRTIRTSLYARTWINDERMALSTLVAVLNRTHASAALEHTVHPDNQRLLEHLLEIHPLPEQQ